MAENVYGKYWWVMSLRGFCAVLFGIGALAWPGIALTVLIIFFGAYALVDGAFAMGAAIKAARAHREWWIFMLEGVSGLVIGTITFFMPEVTAITLLYIIVAWAIITGILELFASFSVPWSMVNKILLGFSGILSVLIGVLLFLFPAGGILTLVWLVAAYALAFGFVLIILGFQMRKLA